MGGGAVGNFQAVHHCIARPNTYPKFTSTQANLLIIADDLNLSLHHTLFRLHLESLGLAAGTINQRLAAVRRLAYEAADSGLLSPELAAGIRRVKGIKQLGCRAGNWLNREQARLLLERSNG